MFELSVARKYLTPRWRQLSVSIISLISILVITLVVWLVVVFFSVLNGLEKSWIQKLILLTAPVRITPTDTYYHSYYYQIDSLSAESQYSLKTIGEKLQADKTDPYDPELDGELPPQFTENEEKDLVKEAFSALKSIPGVSASEYHIVVGNIRLNLARGLEANSISQPAYFGALEAENPQLKHVLQPVTADDVNNLLSQLSAHFAEKDFADRLKRLFGALTIRELITPVGGWAISKNLLPKEARFEVCLVQKDGKIISAVIPDHPRAIESLITQLNAYGYAGRREEVVIKEGKASIDAPLAIAGGFPLPVSFVNRSLEQAIHPHALRFSTAFKLQGVLLEGEIALGNLAVSKFEIMSKPEVTPFWVYQENHTTVLPTDSEWGEGVVLPRSFADSGALIGDRGEVTYLAPTLGSTQEQNQPVYIAGFYDPGIIPIGGKFIMAKPKLINKMRSSQHMDDTPLTNGINVRFADLNRVDDVKKAIQDAFSKAGISSYWKVETYREYEFTKDLIQQLRSEKNLWSLLAMVIIIVACSNIISMLVILVNDKKLEIGILRAMGATSFSIALIFGTCGMIMGMAGSIIGTFAAWLTLKNLQVLVNFISKVQGFEMFNPLFYGNILPSEISVEALSFVIVTTSFVSLLAGIVPAVKASMLRPSIILRSE